MAGFAEARGGDPAVAEADQLPVQPLQLAGAPRGVLVRVDEAVDVVEVLGQEQAIVEVAARGKELVAVKVRGGGGEQVFVVDIVRAEGVDEVVGVEVGSAEKVAVEIGCVDQVVVEVGGVKYVLANN